MVLTSWVYRLSPPGNIPSFLVFQVVQYPVRFDFTQQGFMAFQPKDSFSEHKRIVQLEEIFENAIPTFGTKSVNISPKFDIALTLLILTRLQKVRMIWNRKNFLFRSILPEKFRYRNTTDS